MTTEQRMERLERRNKILVGWCVVLTSLIAVVSWRAFTVQTMPDELTIVREVALPEGNLPHQKTVSAEFGVFEQIQVQRIYMSDPDRGVIMLDMDEHGPTVSVHAAKRGYIHLRVWNGQPTVYLEDEQGYTATLGCADVRSRHASVEPKRRASSLYLQGKQGQVIWKAPKD
jgi:hypothetical protein